MYTGALDLDYQKKSENCVTIDFFGSLINKRTFINQQANHLCLTSKDGKRFSIPFEKTN